MNGINLSLLLSLGLFAPIAGCTRENASYVLSDDVEIHQDIVAPLNALALVCPANAMVFFVGSSEIISSISKWDITETESDRIAVERRQREEAEKFKTAIDKAKSDLIRGFYIDPKCPNETSITFISIIDHYQENDSSIESLVFKKTAATWNTQQTRRWQLKDNTLVAETGSAELDTSKDVERIIHLITSNKIDNIENSDTLITGSEIPGQVSYIIKTHGGRVATDPDYLPRLDNFTAKPRTLLSPSEWEPAFLIDRIGTSGALTSEVFSAHWTKTLFQTIAGDPGATSGDSDATSGDSDATSGDSDATSGDDISGTNLSGAKSLSFKESLVKQDSTFDYLGRMNWGSYATYGSDMPYSIKFPVSGKGASSTPKNLIIMDSCHASNKILKALKYKGGRSGNTVVLASTNPIYYEFLDYSHFNAANFLKFPALLEKLEKNSGLSPSEKTLRNNLITGTLNWENDSIDVSTKFKKLEIWLD